MKKDKAVHRLLERASRPRGDVRPQGPCLDPETFAAWADGSMTTIERTAAETHAADCDRCLAVLAAIAKSAPPPPAIQRPSWLSVRWLAPLTAAAVAITAWVIIQEPPEPVPLPTPPSTLAVDAVKPADPAAPPERDTRTDAANLQKKVESDTASRALTDQTEARRAAKSPAVGAVAPAPQTAAPSQPPPAAAAPAPAALARAEAQQERLQSAARDVIVSPDPDVRWRLAGRNVERSTDGGQTWQVQPTGTALELLAGSAPAPAVCWIVGRGGTVLLATDGATWRRLPFPDTTIDLAGVTARDALDATVTAADGRRYRTTDAGQTWVLQENPAAPF
jgi:hypothetical protein